jgi:phospholipase/carboxylesterase
MHNEPVVYAGADLATEKKALIMLHGRGAQAEDMLGLANHLKITDFALVAPHAAGNSWYPYSFIAPVAQNEPWLSTSLQLVAETISAIVERGISTEHIYLLGFSQGACLTLEFAARNAMRYGGIIAFTGGLIGQEINRMNYHGNFLETPVFIGTSDLDFHVPVQRVDASAEILTAMGAVVTKKVYKNMGHTINQDELLFANSILQR